MRHPPLALPGAAARIDRPLDTVPDQECTLFVPGSLAYGLINEVNLVWIVLTNCEERKHRKCGSFPSLSLLEEKQSASNHFGLIHESVT